MPLLRANSPVRGVLGDPGVELLESIVGGFERLLPHIQLGKWREGVDPSSSRVAWESAERRGIRITIALPSPGGGRHVTTVARRRPPPRNVGNVPTTLDLEEYKICGAFVNAIAETLVVARDNKSKFVLRALEHAIDEQIVSQYLTEHHRLDHPIANTLAGLRELAGETYENLALSFGCVIDPDLAGYVLNPFPQGWLKFKRYRALSDGYHTAFLLSAQGSIEGFVDLNSFGQSELGPNRNYPEWARPMARASLDGKLGIALTRNGDILVFENGNLRFTNRFGRWQYWNHSYLAKILRALLRGQKVPTSLVGRVASELYRSALDASFRRRGALFVVLRRRSDLAKLVRTEDRMQHFDRPSVHFEFDLALQSARSERPSVFSLRRTVLSDLASLDGAVVLDRTGRLLAYGAVLRPPRAGRLTGSEGSRTKAAVGASYLGIAVKISSDGGITIYDKGREYMSI